jgi:drug/metabolite transporter (DMT)-like permease
MPDGSRRQRWTTKLLSSGTPGQQDDPIAAVMWVTVGMVGLAGLSGFAKYCSQQGVEPVLIAFFRNLFCFLMMTPLLAWRGPGIMLTRNWPLYGTRVMLTMISMWCWFTALTMIGLAELQAIAFLSPLFATVFAMLYLGERVNTGRWIALAVGLVGALIILRPFGGGFATGQILALLAAVAIGVVGPLVKQLTTLDDADKIVFITNMSLVPISLVPALFVWKWPAVHLWPFLAAMGICATIGHVALVRAYHRADASLVATFEFSRLPFSVLIGLYFFAELTDVWTWVGAIVIFAASFHVTRSEAAARRRRPTG